MRYSSEAIVVARYRLKSGQVCILANLINQTPMGDVIECLCLMCQPAFTQDRETCELVV